MRKRKDGESKERCKGRGETEMGKEDEDEGKGAVHGMPEGINKLLTGTATQ